MKNKIFIVCFGIAMCFAGANLNAFEESSSDPIFSVEQKITFAKESSEIFEQFCNTLKSLYTPLGTDILEPQKLCDVSHLNKINYLLDRMPVSIKKCHGVYIQRQRDLETKLSNELFSKAEDRVLFLQSLEENDKASRWVDQYCEIHKSLVQQLKEVINFLIQNHGHYQVQNKQLIFDSMDMVKRGSALFEGISNLQQKEVEHLNLLPKP